MMGDRDYRSVIRTAAGAVGRELAEDVDASDHSTIHVHEAARCLRRSYYDRTDPVEQEAAGFGEMVPGLLRRLGHGGEPAEYETGDSRLRGRADMISDDIVMIFRHADEMPENPPAADILYLNACLWIYGKQEGVVIYMGGGGESAFSLARDSSMFEELVRRSKVLSEMLDKKRTPIIEPSSECQGCQYYGRCYTNRRHGKQASIARMLGVGE
ncbi:MAG: hypothetical protein MPI95_02210 [Nitrosopumilus sp.]|nr:hypothetical protein [Nitrosopumilus sp.]MDA7941179.1 hypothetical protein [Nitrosopumilus sp.]MDA7942423.1 hypothetical protein [Nitrosopumilus sp.]MDA7944856.1 hypothetical protein [Nitrosopumilus sp.]MDA7953697.1 hypothetical protein [Nitrosopumilus sp.]